MEISGVSSKAYTSAAASLEEEDELKETQESSEYDEDDVEEKATNYLKNIMFTTNLTDKSAAALQNYLNTFDVAQFIKTYGPFTSTSEISAAMYVATSGMIKQQQDE